MINLEFINNQFVCTDPESVEKCEKNFFGIRKKKTLVLTPEEALYLLQFQNARCTIDGEQATFSKVLSRFPKEQRFFVRYNAYRDWRDRGLILERFRKVKGAGFSKKKYPSRKPQFAQMDSPVYWFSDSFYGVIEDPEIGKELFNEYWIGQLGIYKQDRGNQLKLDFLEVIFLGKHFGATLIDNKTGKEISAKGVLDQVVKEREYAKQLYEVYEDWRLRSYIVKTGFKFGSHFRIYFPGASPAKGGKWTHSKHVLHVFPKDQKLLVSEWARAVRVAHSVKKTFLLGIPELTSSDYVDYPAEYIAYRRKKHKGNLIRETLDDKPRYLLVPVSEDEHIGGVELASLLKKAQDLGLELLLSITDRETAITYYVLKRVTLPGSTQEYYEIEWMKP